MYSSTTYGIRDVRVQDVPELVRLGWANERDWPSRQRRYVILGAGRTALVTELTRAADGRIPGR